jgi:hypothetical protein
VRNQKIDKQVEDDSWSDVWMQSGWMKLYTSLAFLMAMRQKMINYIVPAQKHLYNPNLGLGRIGLPFRALNETKTNQITENHQASPI